MPATLRSANDGCKRKIYGLIFSEKKNTNSRKSYSCRNNSVVPLSSGPAIFSRLNIETFSPGQQKVGLYKYNVLYIDDF